MLSIPTTDEIGIDEAGRGCLWGPMYAAAVFLSADKTKWSSEFTEIADKIKDSKKLTPKRREAIFKVLQNCGLVYGLGRVESYEIDKLGATAANQLAFRRAIDSIPADVRKGVAIKIDGVMGLREEREGEKCETEIDGDNKFLSIATASVIAKESHDTWVKKWCEEHKDLADRYGFAQGKGYGTAKHRGAVKEYGLHTEHRRLYCRKLIPGLTVDRYDFVDS